MTNNPGEIMEYSEAQIRTMFTNSPIGIYIVTRGTFSYVNPRFEDISGHSASELMTVNPLDIVSPGDREDVRTKAVMMLKGRLTAPYEYTIKDNRGITRHILESVSSIRFEGETATLGHFMDVTDARITKRSLEASELKYRSFYELAREGILVVNYEDGTILEANREFERQSGLSITQLQSRKIWEIQPREFQEEARKSFLRFKENRGGIVSWNLCQNQNGKMLPVEIVAQHMTLDGQDKILCMVRDISEREALLRALSMASEEWRKSFDALDDVVLLISPDFRILRANLAAARLLEIDIRQLIGMKCHRLLHGTDAPPAFCPHLKAQARGLYCQAEENEPHLDRILSFSASPIKDAQGNITHTVEVISDVTASRKNEKESLRLGQALADSFKGITAALSELVESRDPYTAGHSKHVAELAVRTGKQLGLDENDLEGLHVCALLHDIGKAIIPAAILNKPGKLSTHEWGFIREHPTTAHETLKRIPFPWPVADVVHQHHERLDGSGYPQGLQEDRIHFWTRIIAVADIFDAMTSHRPYRPSLPRQKAMDELAKGRGITFDPRVIDAIHQVLTLHDRRVLVVDYDTEIVEAFKSELIMEEFEPTGCATSESALAEFSGNPFPVAIIELEMPGTSGTVLTRKIKEISPLTEVIVTAKHYSKEDTLGAFRAGASDFLDKPVDLVMFRKSIHRALNRFAAKR
ncbi:MAG: HD domain-containing phosphohydrolase [Pseudomonadota bacterium]